MRSVPAYIWTGRFLFWEGCMEKKRDQADVTAIRLRPELRQRVDRVARSMGLSRSAFLKACANVVLAGEAKREKQR